MWIYPAIFLAAVFFLLYKYSTRNFDYWEKRNVFYLKPLPFLGNFLDLVKETSIGHSLMEMYKFAGDRDFFGIFIFGRPTLMVKSPKLIKTILQKDSANFIDRTFSSMSNQPVMSNALFFQRSSVWKDHRAKLSPMFTSGKLKLMYPLMVKECNEMTDYIKKIVDVPDVESKEICAKYSTNVITRCAFAVDANSYQNEDAIFRKLGRAMFDFRISTALRQFGNFLTPGLYEMLQISFLDPSIIKTLGGIFTDVLHTRKASKVLKGNDLVDILLESSRKNGENVFSEEAMLGQAIQLFAAGFETVAATLSFSLYELCVNPEVQEKLRDEINEALQKNNGSITYEELQELKYLDMCLSETLRKYPPVPFLDRTCKADYKVEDSDFVIEKGMSIFISPDSLHYNPKYFPDPEKYDPERFADKSNLNSDGLWYIPFGDGPRICIGQRFGLMETKIALVSILSKFRIEKSSKTPIPIKYARKSLVLQSEVGIPLKFVSV